MECMATIFSSRGCEWLRVVGGGAEVGSGEYFLIFFSGGLTVFIIFPVIVEMKSLHCALLHFHFEKFIWPLIKAHLPLHLGECTTLGLMVVVTSPLKRALQGSRPTAQASARGRHNNGHFKIVTARSLFTKCEANRETWRRLCRWHCCWEQMNVFYKLATLAVCYWKSRVLQNCCKGLAGFYKALCTRSKFWQQLTKTKWTAANNKLIRALQEVLLFSQLHWLSRN